MVFPIKSVKFACSIAASLGYAALSTLCAAQQPAKGPVPPAVAAGKRTIPLYFEENRGQMDSNIRYVAHGGGYTAYLTGKDAILRYAGDGKTTHDASFRMSLAGGSEVSALQPQQRLEGVVNYLLGPDSSKWLTHIPTYGQVEYGSVYPGVDLVYHGSGQELEFDFHVRAGADPGQVRLQFNGTSQARIDQSGNLILSTAAGPSTFLKPVVYQDSPAGRTLVAAAYELLGKDQVGFRLGAYDHSRPLIIDPTLLSVKYSTYLGSGTSGDTFRSMAVDTAGEAFICGNTTSTSFPVTSGAYRTSFPSGITTVGFVTALNANGTALKYSTYIAGTSTNSAISNNGTLNAIAVNSAGNAFVAGSTDDTTFPSVKAFQSGLVPLQGSPAGYDHQDGIVFELSADGSGLVYSTFLGGADGYNNPTAIAVDTSNAAYVTGTLQVYTSSNGSAHSSHFPTTSGAIWGSFNQNDIGAGFDDAFAVKIGAPTTGNSTRAYSTVIGSASALVPLTYGTAVAVDTAGNAYFAGTTNGNIADHGGTITTSTNMTNVNRSAGEYVSNAYVLELNSTASSAVYLDYLGGNAPSGSYSPNTSMASIAVDASGQAYVAGTTQASNFQTTSNALYPTRRLAGVTSTVTGSTTIQSDGYVVIIPASGLGGFTYSTYLNGTTESAVANNDMYQDGSLSMTGIALGTGGQFTVTGAIVTSNYPTVATTAPAKPIQTTFDNTEGYADFITKFAPPLTAGGGLQYSEFVGYSGYQPNGIASNGTDVYVMLPEESPVAGETTAGAYDSNDSSTFKELIVRIQDGSGATTLSTNTSVSSAAVTTMASAQTIALTSTVSSSATVNGGTVTYTVTNSGGTAVGSSVISGTVTNNSAPSVNYTLPVNTAAGTYTITGAYSGATGFAASSGTNTLTVNSAPTTTLAVGAVLLTQGSPASFTPVTGSGGTGSLTYTVSPALPSGLSMTTTNGMVSGTPTVTSSTTSYTVTVKDADNVSSSKSFSLTVNPTVTATRSVAAVAFTQNRSITTTAIPVTGGGGTGSLFYTVSPSLPAGLSFSMTTGAITGAPTATLAATTYAVSVTDVNGSTAGNTFSLTVLPASYTASTTQVGTPSVTQVATLAFSSPVTLNSSLSTAVRVVTQGATGLDYAYISGGTCQAGAVYAANASCTVQYTFAPNAPGQRLGAILLYDNAATPVLQASALLSGLGNGPLALFQPGMPANTYSSTLTNPQGLSVDTSGNLYFANSGARSVVEFAAGSTTPTTLATVATYSTEATAVDGAGNVYYTISLAGGTDVFELLGGSGSPMSIATLPNNDKPDSNLSVDGAGNLFLTGTNGGIYEVAAGNHAVTILAAPSAGHRYAGAALDTNGNFFLADTATNSLDEISAGTTSLRTLYSGGSLSSPQAVAVDAAGNVYVANGNSSKVVRFAAGNYGAAPVTLAAPGQFALAIDGAGTIYFAPNNSSLASYTRSTNPFINFPNTAIGSTSTATVTLENDGNALLTFPNPASGTNPAIFGNFTFTSGAGCPLATPSGSAQTLAIGANCTETLKYTPTISAVVSGYIQFTDDSLNGNSVKQSASMTGSVAQGLNVTAVGQNVPSGIPSISLEFTVGYGSNTPPTAQPTLTVNSSAAGVGPVTCLLKAGHNNCTATYNTSSLAPGAYTILATQPADSTYTTAVSGTAVLTILGPAGVHTGQPARGPISALQSLAPVAAAGSLTAAGPAASPLAATTPALSAHPVSAPVSVQPFQLTLPVAQLGRPVAAGVVLNLSDPNSALPDDSTADHTSRSEKPKQ